MFAQLAGQVKTDGCLDFAASDGMFLVVVSQTRRLGGDTLEDVVHKRVHDAHGFAGDASVWMDLLQNLVDVDRVALFARLPPLFAFFSCGFGFSSCCFLFTLLGSYLARHD